MDFLVLVLAGFFSGVFASMGLGGGFILLLYLNFFTDISIEESRLINIIFFIIVGGASLFTHFKNGFIDTQIAKSAICFGSIGAVLGCILAKFFGSELITHAFGVFLLIIGVSELIKSFKKE